MRTPGSVLLALSLLSVPALADGPKPEDFPEGENPNIAPYDEFMSKPRHVNFRLDPVAPLLNWDLFLKQWGATVDIAITKDLTLGPSIRGGPSFKQGDSYSFVEKLGITGGWYLNGTRLTDSFVIWPNWFFWSIPNSHTAPGDQLFGVLDDREVSILAGFQWFYTGGWNFNAGVGLKYRYHVQNFAIVNSHGAVSLSDLNQAVSISTELMLGWAK